MNNVSILNCRLHLEDQFSELPPKINIHIKSQWNLVPINVTIEELCAPNNFQFWASAQAKSDL